MGCIAVSAGMGFLSLGCAALSHVQTADTLGQGHFQFAVEPGMGGATVLAGRNSSSFTYPHVDLALRFGVLDRLDLGVRIGSSLLEVQSKILLTPPDHPHLAISLAPSVMPLAMRLREEDSSHQPIRWTLPVLFGLKTEKGSEVVVGPRVMLTRFSSPSAGAGSSDDILSVGLSLGSAIRVSQAFRVMPEVGISLPVGSQGSKAPTDREGGLLQVKIGFLFGTGRPIPRQEEDMPDESWEEPATSADPQEDSIPEEEPPDLETDPGE